MKLLHIKVSPNLQGSSSRKVSQHLLEKLQSSYPELRELVLDLSVKPLPHLDALTTGAFLTKPEDRTAEQNQAIQLSEQLVDMLLETDILLLSSPMWNLGLPSVLKAWFDHITRAGRTFAFAKEGTKVGLVSNKKVYVVVSSGSCFSQGPFANDDQFTPYIKVALAYIGIEDVTFIRVDGTHFPLTKDTALAKALSAVDVLTV